MAVFDGDQTLGSTVENRLAEHPDHLRARPPGDVESRDRVAVAGSETGATLGPTDCRHHTQAQIVQIRTLFAGGEVHVGLGPLPRPVVLTVTIESGGTEPVLPGQFDRILDAESALLGGIDEEQTTQRPESLPTQVLFVLLFQHGHTLAGLHQFMGCDQPGKPAPDHNDVKPVGHHGASSRPIPGMTFTRRIRTEHKERRGRQSELRRLCELPAPPRREEDTWGVVTTDSGEDGHERQRFRKLAQAAMNADVTVGQLDTIIGDLGGALTDFDRAMGEFDRTLGSFGAAMDDFSATLARVDSTVTKMVAVVERIERVVGRVENIVDVAETLIAPVASAEAMVRGLLGIGRRR